MEYKKSKVQNFPPYIAFMIKCNFNTTRIDAVTQDRKLLLAWETPGKQGFKGSKGGTPFAAINVATAISKLCVQNGVKRCDVYIVGVTMNKEPVVRTLDKFFEIVTMQETIKVRHGGCRPRSRRRV